jgi:hypothetical protein
VPGEPVPEFISPSKVLSAVRDNCGPGSRQAERLPSGRTGLTEGEVVPVISIGTLSASIVAGRALPSARPESESDPSGGPK